MPGYDEQYSVEKHLFGEPYPEFVAFVRALGIGGNALDLGCGQGRDALMLAACGFRVTGIDASRVGIAQMTERARARGLDVTGVVGDYYLFAFPEDYDAVVLDSILHFGADSDRELALLDRVFAHTKAGGHVFIFMQKSRAKERRLKGILDDLGDDWDLVEDREVDYVYEESRSGFRSVSQFAMVVTRRREREGQDT